MVTSVIGFLLRGPARLAPLLRWAIAALALGGAALLVWSAVIHLELWADGYRDISVIGPLFLAQGVGNIVLALVVVAFRRLVVLAAGSATLLATAVGLLWTVYYGLFNYKESLAAPYTTLSLYVEFVGAGVLAVAALILALAPAVRSADASGNPFRVRSRT
jgi:hypothetical protein